MPEDFSKLRVPDLKIRLKARGLPVSGKKAALVARLEAAGPAATNGAASVAAPVVDPETAAAAVAAGKAAALQVEKRTACADVNTLLMLSGDPFVQKWDTWGCAPDNMEDTAASRQRWQSLREAAREELRKLEPRLKGGWKVLLRVPSLGQILYTAKVRAVTRGINRSLYVQPRGGLSKSDKREHDEADGEGGTGRDEEEIDMAFGGAYIRIASALLRAARRDAKLRETEAATAQLVTRDTVEQGPALFLPPSRWAVMPYTRKDQKDER